MASENILVSIIIPAFNEEGTIIKLLQRVNQQNVAGIDLEIIVINDASTDKTGKLLTQHSDLYALLISNQRNLGKGASVAKGIEASKGEYILMQDADLEYDPSDYNALFMPIKQLAADIVLGTRMSSALCSRVHYFWHRIGNKLLTLIFNIMNNTTFTDIYSCYLLFRKDLLNVNALRTAGWEQQAEILSKIVKNAKKMYEVPINYYGRTYDEGKKIRWYHTAVVIAAILRFRILN